MAAGSGCSGATTSSSSQPPATSADSSRWWQKIALSASGNDRDRVAPSRPITTSKVQVVRVRREMMIESLPRLNTHADPGMGRVSANVARCWIREAPYEDVGRGRNYQADWAHVDPGARGSGDELSQGGCGCSAKSGRRNRPPAGNRLWRRDRAHGGRALGVTRSRPSRLRARSLFASELWQEPLRSWKRCPRRRRL
jgi:hypothetical protein